MSNQEQRRRERMRARTLFLNMALNELERMADDTIEQMNIMDNNGWDVEVINTRPYGVLQRRLERLLERIDEIHYLLDNIEEEAENDDDYE